MKTTTKTQQVLLKDVCIFSEGYVNPSQKHPEYFGGDIKWLRANDICGAYINDTSRKLTQLGYDSAGKSSRLFKPNTIVISKSGTIGRTGIIRDFMCGNRAIINIEPQSGHVDYRYLYYWLVSKHMLIKSLAVGSVQKNLYIPVLSGLQLDLPPLPTQRRIAVILSSLDDKIENNRRICAKLEEMAQALFKRWFVDFEFPDAEGKPYKSNGGEMVYCDELGKEVPKGWRVGILNDIGQIVGGSTPSKSRPEYYTNKGIPWLTPRDLSGYSFIFISHGATDITEEGYNSCSTKLMPKGSVLFSSRAPIGYIAIASNDICTNQGFKSLMPSKGYGTEFLYHYLKWLTPRIKNAANGSTFKEISTKGMAHINIVLPNLPIVERFCSQIKQVHTLIELRENETTICKRTRDGLLPKLMTGEIDF